MIIYLIAGYIKRISIYKMNYSITYSHNKNKIKVELDLFNYIKNSIQKGQVALIHQNFVKKLV